MASEAAHVPSLLTKTSQATVPGWWASLAPALRLAWTACRSRRAKRYARLCAAIVLVTALSLGVVVAPVNWSLLGHYGYIGVFVITLVASGALVVPVPYLGVIIVAGMFLNPILVALTAGVASALGELTGYYLGKSGRAVLPRNRYVQGMERGMQRFGAPVIFVAAAVPNPFFDVAGILAGATKLPVWLYIVATFSGKTLRFLVLAVLGSSFHGG